MLSRTLKRGLKKFLVGFYQDLYANYYSVIGKSSNLKKEIAPNTLINLDITQRIQFIQWKRKQYEPHIYKLAMDNLKSGDTALDIGAHVGYFTLLFASQVGGGGKVIAVEPESSNFESLSKNVKENSLTQVALYNFALSSHSGEANLLLSNINEGGHSVQSAESNSSGRRVKIKTISLDEILKKENISQCKLMKMDVEGHELECLKGMEQTLSNNSIKPKHIIIEVSSGEKEKRIQVLDLMSKYGYANCSWVAPYPEIDLAQSSYEDLHFVSRIH